MGINSIISDGKDGRTVRVVGGNALAVNPPHPSISFNATLDVDDTAVNIVPAKADNRFFLTGVILVGNKNISATVDATVNIYTAVAADTAVGALTTSLFTLPVARSGSIILTPILVETAEGEFINGETSDDDVLVTLLGYYIKNED
jgi:hypothetical protein